MTVVTQRCTFPDFFSFVCFWRSKEWLDVRGALSAHVASAPYPCAQRQAQALSDVLVISLPGDSRLPGPWKTFEELIERGSVRALAFLAHRFFFCCSVFLSEVELSPRSLSSEVFIFSLSDEASPTRIRAGAPRRGPWSQPGCGGLILQGVGGSWRDREGRGVEERRRPDLAAECPRVQSEPRPQRLLPVAPTLHLTRASRPRPP